MTVDEAIALIEKLLDLGCLNKVQDLVVRYAWEGKSYQKLADEWGYTHGHLKDTGYKLWKDLTLAIGDKEKVTKNNLQLVLERYHPQPAVGFITNSYVDWGDAMDVSFFYERTEDLATLKQWIIKDRCRFITLYGMGGIGKTALAAKLGEQIQGDFEVLIWRSLRNSPPISSVLTELLKSLSSEPIPTAISQQILQLIHCLRQRRCFLILDNVDSVLQGSEYTGKYREGYEGYGHLFRCMAEMSHQSIVVLTTREIPKGLMIKEGMNLPIRSLQVKGLSTGAVQKIFQDRGVFWAFEVEWKALSDRYGGNPLVLRMVASTIQDLFGSSISEFLKLLIYKTSACIEVYHLFEQQYNRLSEIEKEIVFFIASNRKSISFQELKHHLIPKLSSGQVVDAIASLRRRSFIEKIDASLPKWRLQPIVVEFIKENIISQDKAS